MNPRRPSNKLKQRQLQTKYLQEQTKKMQEKLNELRKQVQEQKQLKASNNFQSTISRWKKNTRSDAPLKNYAKQILQQQKQAYKKFGVDHKKITGTKTFTNIKKRLKQEKEQEEDKNPTKIPSLMSNTNGSIQSLPQPFDQKNQLIDPIQNNFFKAKIDVKNLVKQKTVLEFLQEIFLQHYNVLFQQNNITELSDLRFLSQQQLNEMGLPKGHQIKIMKKIKQEFDKSKSPTKMVNITKEQPQQQKPAGKVLVQMGYGDGDINQYANIQRQQNSQNEELQQNFDEANSQNLSETEQNDVVLITVPMSEIALQTGNGNQDEMQQSMSENCFNCYKLIPLKNQKHQSPDGRNFCSINCLKVYKMQMQKTCPACSTQFFKTNGYYQEGLWFCSIKCCPNKEQIEQMFLEWTERG